MKLLLLFCTALVVFTAAPAEARDHRGDGHFRFDRDGGRRHYDHRPYVTYRRGYYPYRSYGYGYGYGYPYYSRPALGLGFTYYSSPSYTRSYASSRDNVAVEVQRELRRRGYYRGALDGLIGPQTRAAIRTFQYDEDLRVTGRIDSRLLDELDI